MEIRQRLREWLLGRQDTAPAAEVIALEPAVSSISVTQSPENAPRFARVYEARLDESASIAVTLSLPHYGSKRIASGELTQPNGRWVSFDPWAVADKILDPRLLPLIQRHVDEIFRMDAEFMRAAPSQFIDERGHAWGRLPAMREVRHLGVE